MPDPSDLPSELPSDLRLLLHGPTAACHEQHAAPGSFAAAVGALARARVEGRRVFVASWITRSTCRSLVELVDLLVGHGVAGWSVAWPWVHAPAGAAVARTVPRLGIAVPHALRAVERATRRGLAVAVVGVPSCALGPFAAQGLVGEEGLRTPQASELERAAEGLRTPQASELERAAKIAAGAFPRACEGCPARAGCCGVDPWYLERFGSQELHPVAAVPRARRPEGVAEALAAAAAELEAIA